MKPTHSSTQTKLITNVLLLAGLVTSALLLYKYTTQQGETSNRTHKKLDDDNNNNSSSSPTKGNSHSTGAKDSSSSDTPKHSNKSPTSNDEDPRKSKANNLSAEALISQLEALDKRGKALFREHKYMDAAEVYTEALDLIEVRMSNHSGHDADADDGYSNGTAKGRNNFYRQKVTLLNNRCAMYEKGGFSDLALIGTYSMTMCRCMNVQYGLYALYVCIYSCFFLIYCANQTAAASWNWNLLIARQELENYEFWRDSVVIVRHWWKYAPCN